MTKQAYQRRRKAKIRARRNKTLQEIVVYIGITLIVFCSLYFFSVTRMLNKSQVMNKSYYRVVKIEKGDTLWKVAERYAPRNSDYRLYISQIVEINKLSSANVYAGQKILVPAEGAPPAESRKNLACLSYSGIN